MSTTVFYFYFHRVLIFHCNKLSHLFLFCVCNILNIITMKLFLNLFLFFILNLRSVQYFFSTEIIITTEEVAKQYTGCMCNRSCLVHMYCSPS